MIDLRAEKRNGSWVRCLGAHEQAGLEVSVNDVSAYVTLTAQGIRFGVDRTDIPAAWDDPIDVVKLREQLVAAVVRKMSATVLEELFREFHLQHQRAFRDGEHATRLKIREAIGL